MPLRYTASFTRRDWGAYGITHDAVTEHTQFNDMIR